MICSLVAANFLLRVLLGLEARRERVVLLALVAMAVLLGNTIAALFFSDSCSERALKALSPRLCLPHRDRLMIQGRYAYKYPNGKDVSYRYNKARCVPGIRGRDGVVGQTGTGGQAGNAGKDSEDGRSGK